MARTTALSRVFICWAAIGVGTVGCYDAQDENAELLDSDAASFTIEVSLSELIPTVATVAWTLPLEQDAVARVEYSTDDVWRHSDHVTRQEDHFSCTLVGLIPRSEYRVRAVMVTDAGERASEEVGVLTGALPAAFPDMQMDIDPDEDGSDGYVVTSFIGAFSAAVIVDIHGNVVWWHEPPYPLAKIARAVLARDGQSVLYMCEEQTEIDEDQLTRTTHLVRVAMDGSTVETFTVDRAHHDFVELPGGNLAILVHDKRLVDGWDYPVFGDRIEEYAPDGGEPEVVWSSFDSWSFEGGALVTGYYDWTHANAIDYDVDGDVYTVSLNHQRTLVTIDRQTGELVEQIGGDESDFDFIEGEERTFGPQHQFQFVEGGVLVFDNGTPGDYESRAIEVALDTDLMTAEVSWIHVASPSLFCPCQGDVSRLPSGNNLVTWSTSGQLEEVSPDGEVLWQLNLELGTVIGYTNYVTELGIPGIE